MPSTNKTTFLGLNKWLGSDKPKMEDFNSDNQKLDDAIKAHQEDNTLHITPQQQGWLASPFVLGSYVGNAQEQRVIPLSFTPRFVAVLCNDRPLVEYHPYLGHNRQYAAMACTGGGMTGVRIVSGGFEVIHFGSAPVEGGVNILMNMPDQTYHYFAMR